MLTPNEVSKESLYMNIKAVVKKQKKAKGRTKERGVHRRKGGGRGVHT